MQVWKLNDFCLSFYLEIVVWLFDWQFEVSLVCLLSYQLERRWCLEFDLWNVFVVEGLYSLLVLLFILQFLLNIFFWKVKLLLQCSSSYGYFLSSRNRFYLSLIVYCIGFLSLGHIPRFYLNLFFVHLVSHYWDTILDSILVYSLLIWFFIIRTSSWVQSKLNCLFLWFLIIGTPS